MSPIRPHTLNGVTMRLRSKHCPWVKCNPHGVDILFFMFCDFFAARTDQGIQSISTIVSTNDVGRGHCIPRGSPRNIFASTPKQTLKSIESTDQVDRLTMESSRVDWPVKSRVDRSSRSAIVLNRSCSSTRSISGSTPKSPKTQFWGTFQYKQNLSYRELSVNRTVMELRS